MSTTYVQPKLLDLSVDWLEGYSNSPSLDGLVDHIPYVENFDYQERRMGNYTLFWAQLGDLVSFFAHDPYNQEGYGGRPFTLRVNGTERLVIGPWASNSSAMNMAGFPPCVECHVKQEGGFTRTPYAVLVETAIPILQPKGLTLYKHGDHYIPHTLVGCHCHDLNKPCSICQTHPKLR